jgi:hypothetical protein
MSIFPVVFCLHLIVIHDDRNAKIVMFILMQNRENDAISNTMHKAFRRCFVPGATQQQ